MTMRRMRAWIVGGFGGKEGAASTARRRGEFSKRIATFALSAWLASPLVLPSALAAELEGMHYDDAIRVAGSKLVLNGLGIRAVAVFKGYVAGLYLPKKETDAEAVFAQSGAKRIAVRMLVAVDSALLAKTFDDGLKKNYRDDELAALKPRMDSFDAVVRGLGGVKKGDSIDLEFVPARGTQVLLNGAPHGDAILGDDFYVALLKMFIGERAVDKNLRAALLGKSG